MDFNLKTGLVFYILVCVSPADYVVGYLEINEDIVKGSEHCADAARFYFRDHPAVFIPCLNVRKVIGAHCFCKYARVAGLYGKTSLTRGHPVASL